MMMVVYEVNIYDYHKSDIYKPPSSYDYQPSYGGLDNYHCLSIIISYDLRP